MRHALHEVVQLHRDVILERWKMSVSGRFAPETLPVLELLDHFPIFLDEVIEALRAHADGEPQECETSTVAAIHGEQRLRLGFSLAAVVREYEALREVIEDAAIDVGAPVAHDEARCLGRSITGGIATAVSEYSRQRDVELARQHNEHIGFIAHELRNPLSTASLALQMLFNEQQLSMTLRPSRALARSIESMQSLIDHALRAASAAAAGVDVKRELITLKALIDDSSLVTSIDAETFGVGFRVKLETDGELFVDVRLVRSALGNLLRNAVRYSHRGGMVELRARVMGELAILEVEDTCGGLEPGKVEQAFLPFVRLDTEKTGFGLGLSIAKQAVDAHGGSIRVQNLPGKGCIFAMELPLAASQMATLVGT